MSEVAESHRCKACFAGASANLIVVLSFSPIVLSQYFLKPFHYPRLNLRIVKQCRYRGASQVQLRSAAAGI